MRNTRKILIRTESHEIFIMRVGSKESFHGFCSECCREVQLLTLDQAVSVSGIGAKEIFRLVEVNSIHAIETDTKHLLICLASIANGNSNLLENKEK